MLARFADQLTAGANGTLPPPRNGDIPVEEDIAAQMRAAAAEARAKKDFWQPEVLEIGDTIVGWKRPLAIGC